jgi:hypothetical protein
MTSLAKRVYRLHPKYREKALDARRCTPERLGRSLHHIIARSNGTLQLIDSGRSIEGREIPLLRFGNGPRRILAWTQMHGDEPTATLAILDILRFLSLGGAEKEGLEHLGKRCSFFVIPMLNPDGATRGRRHTAAWIDMNRDAKNFRTPEAQFLRRAHARIKPSFGFNLHDQEISSVGTGPAITAIALLAPSPHHAKRMTAVRKKAMHVAGVIARSLELLAKGKIACYDDSHEPRAFGDTMQAWGTSTILVESGHWSGDRGKEIIRRLNFAGLLEAFECIAMDSQKEVRLAPYMRLKPNGKRAYHIIVRGAQVAHGTQWKGRVDIGLLREPGQSDFLNPMMVIKEVGDLRGFGALEVLRPGSRILKSGEVAIDSRLTRKKVLSRWCGRP